MSFANFYSLTYILCNMTDTTSNSPKFQPVTHVIFDMDGLLINTEDLYTQLFTKICAEYGTTYTFECKANSMGRKRLEVIAATIEFLKIKATVINF